MKFSELSRFRQGKKKTTSQSDSISSSSLHFVTRAFYKSLYACSTSVRTSYCIKSKHSSFNVRNALWYFVRFPHSITIGLNDRIHWKVYRIVSSGILCFICWQLEHALPIWLLWNIFVCMERRFCGCNEYANKVILVMELKAFHRWIHLVFI